MPFLLLYFQNQLKEPMFRYHYSSAKGLIEPKVRNLATILVWLNSKVESTLNDSYQ